MIALKPLKRHLEVTDSKVEEEIKLYRLESAMMLAFDNTHQRRAF